MEAFANRDRCLVVEQVRVARGVDWLILDEPESEAEASSIFARDNERLDHLSGLIVPAELIQLRKPEVVAIYVIVRWIVRISPQVAEVLHQDKCPVEFARVERLVLLVILPFT